MTAFYEDPKFDGWLANLKPRDELVVMLALRDRVRDPAIGRAWAVRVKTLEDGLTPKELDDVMASVRHMADELERTMPANDDAPMRRPKAKKMDDPQFGKGGLAQRQILQAIEDVVVDAGMDEMFWATDNGTFIWRRTPKIVADKKLPRLRLIPKRK